MKKTLHGPCTWPGVVKREVIILLSCGTQSKAESVGTHNLAIAYVMHFNNEMGVYSSVNGGKKADNHKSIEGVVVQLTCFSSR